MNNSMRKLAKKQWVSNDDIHSGFNNNDLIIGGSGSGKTGGYVIPLIQQGLGNMIVTDTKSQLYKQLSPNLKAQGYDISVIDFVSPENSASYNPLSYIQRKAETYSQRDIVSLSKILIPKNTTNDSFWLENARIVMSFLISFTLEAFYEEDHSMNTVLEVFRQLRLKSGRKKIENWLIDNPTSFASKKYDMFIEIINADKTWACIMQFVSEALDPFDYCEMQNIFDIHNPNQFDFNELWTKKKIVFLNISDTDRYADQLANLFYTQAIQILCKKADNNINGRLDIPVRFILDDFASNVYIENFDKIISVVRSRNIAMSIILQNLTQLKSMYSESQANTIITNCDHLLYLGGQDIETARYIGYRSNKTEDNILLMPMGKAYFIERGKLGNLVDRIEPYREL